MVDQHLFLNTILNNFTTKTRSMERLVWSGLESRTWINNTVEDPQPNYHYNNMTYSFQEETNKQTKNKLHRGWRSSASNKMVSHVNLREWDHRTVKVGWKSESVVILPTFSALVLLVQACDVSNEISNVDVPNSVTYLNHTPIIEQYTIWCSFKNGFPKKRVLKRDWTTSSKYENHSKVNSGHNWCCTWPFQRRIFTLTMQ